MPASICSCDSVSGTPDARPGGEAACTATTTKDAARIASRWAFIGVSEQTRRCGGRCLTLGIDEVLRYPFSFTERLVDGTFAFAHRASLRNGTVDDRNAQVGPAGGLGCGNLDLLSLVFELA